MCELLKSFNCLLVDSVFQKLIYERNRQNFFSVIGKETDETADSAFLTWMFSDIFCLGEFARECLVRCYCLKRNCFPLAPGELKEMSVEREKTIQSGEARFDVFMENDKYIIIIEDKIKAKEGKEQTVKYHDWVSDYCKECKDKEGKEKTSLEIFLTVDREDASCKSFVNITHQELYDDVIVPCLSHPGLSEMERNFLLDYSNRLSTPIQKDANNVGYIMAFTHKEECAFIYNKYSDLLDMIFKSVEKKKNGMDLSGEEEGYCNYYESDQYKAIFDEIFLSIEDYGRTPKGNIRSKNGIQLGDLVEQKKINIGDFVTAQYGKEVYRAKVVDNNHTIELQVIDTDGNDVVLVRDYYGKTIKERVGGVPSGSLQYAVLERTGKKPSVNGWNRWMDKNKNTLTELRESIS